MTSRNRSPSKPAVGDRLLLGTALQLPLVTSIGSIRGRSASRITWHHHAAFEVLFLVDGVTDYEFADGRTTSLPGGHFMIVPPGVRHRGLDDVRRPARLCGIVFDPGRAAARKNTPFTPSDLRQLTKRFTQCDGRPRPMGAELRRNVVALVGRIHSFRDAVSDAAALRLSVCATLWEAARQLTVAYPEHSHEAVRRACEFMRSGFEGGISMSQIVRAAGCSRARLFRIFKQVVGQTPNDYLQRLRIAKAAELLRRSSCPITSVAFACGFTSSQYFSKVFQKYQGRTPTAYRDAASNK